MNTHKRFRQGQILNLLAQMKVANQDALRRQLVHRGVRVTRVPLTSARIFELLQRGAK